MQLDHWKLCAGLGLAATLGLVACSQEQGQINMSAGASTVAPGERSVGPLPTDGTASLMVTIKQVQVSMGGDDECGGGDDKRDGGVGEVDDNHKVDGGGHEGDHNRDGGVDDVGNKVDGGHHGGGNGGDQRGDGGHVGLGKGDGGHDDGEQADNGDGGDHEQEKGGGCGHDGGVGANPAPLIVFQGAQAIDLLNVAADKVFLGSIKVPAGPITQARLVLDPAMALTINGKSVPVDCPKCGGSGLQVVIPGGMVVQSGGTLDLKLDINARDSVVVDANGYHLSPVVRLVSNAGH